MSKRKSHDAVSTDIEADPADVYALVSDITRMGEWSPECVRCTWSKGATGPEVGTRFKAKNKGGRGAAWFNSPRVTESFEAEKPLGASMTWLTEKWTGSSDRDADLHRGMVTTLERIKAAAERSPA